MIGQRECPLCTVVQDVLAREKYETVKMLRPNREEL